MPLYATLCADCGRRQDVFRTIAGRNALPPCACGGVLSRVLTAPAVSTDIEPYISPATGKLISSRSEQREDLVRTGHFLHEPGVEKDVERNRAYTMEKAFEPVARAVDEKVAQLVSQGQIQS